MTKKQEKKKPIPRVKMSKEEAEGFAQFLRRGSVVPAKKGKGSYNRQKMKRGRYDD